MFFMIRHSFEDSLGTEDNAFVPNIHTYALRGIRVASVYPENEMTISGHHHIATYKYSNMTAFLENRLPLSIQWWSQVDYVISI